MPPSKKRPPKNKASGKSRGPTEAKVQARSPKVPARARVVREREKTKATSKLPEPLSSDSLNEQRFQELLEAAPDGILEGEFSHE